MKRRFLMLLFSLITILFLCDVTFSQTKTPYLIGGISMVTGPGAFVGTPMWDGAVLRRDMINEAGGINGHPIKTIFYDDGGDESRAVLNAKKLIEEDKVIGIIGPGRSGCSLAVIPTVERAGIPFIAFSAATQNTRPVKKWTFAIGHMNLTATRKIIDYMVKNNIKKVAFLPDNTAYGDDAYKSFMQQKPDSIQVLVHETYGDKDSDFTPQLTKAKAAGVDAVVVWNVSRPASIILKNAEMMGMNIPFFYTHGCATPEFAQLAGSAAKNMMVPSGKVIVADELPDKDPQKPVLVKFATEYEKRYKKPVNYFHGYGSDALQIMVDAIARTGDPPEKVNKEKVRSEIEKTKYFGINGIYNMSPTEHNGLSYETMVMLKWDIAKKRYKLLWY